MTCLVCRSPLFGSSRKFCSSKCAILKRPFRVWDGEGITFPDGSHAMTLLANSDGEYIERPEGLHTTEMLNFLIRKRSKAYNVWFSFGYDVNQILREVPLGRPGDKHTLAGLWKHGYTWWKGYRLRYLPRKFFGVTSRNGSFHSSDTFGFFQTSFLKACKEWHLDASAIKKGKESRSTFSQWTPAEILAYNFAELALLKELLERLRDSFVSVNLLPQSWHGPGAIASTWLKREHIHEHYASYPAEMETAIMSGYFGGRIDCARIGEIQGYLRDLASAYPAGLCEAPSLAPLVWYQEVFPTTVYPFALYRVRWKADAFRQWYPFPWRTKHGGVLFPPEGEGWVWGVELQAGMRLQDMTITVLEGWVPQGEKVFPFRAGIQRDFEARRKKKEAKDPSHMAIRLGLNSLYGKLCQHIAEGKDKPRWQNYLWAGFITAWTRAKVLHALAEVGDENLIAVMTDGILTRVPLRREFFKPAPLGEWEDEHEGRPVTVLLTAPGMYAIFTEDGKQKVIKQRGMPASLNYGWILRQWGCATEKNLVSEDPDLPPPKDSFAAANDNFIGMGKAIHQNKPFARFVMEERRMHDIIWTGTSKRYPNPAMYDEESWMEFSLLAKPRHEPVISYPYEWRPALYDPREEKE